ncbi:beta-2-microglobulin-like [Arvicanthis niloticus]|uniref:beta-2-microglobulin-like n=1 Tax=Arvicanthis niloticus TaxID=61156 RepID=UPI00402BA42B
MACWVTLIFLVLVSLTGLHAYTRRAPTVELYTLHPPEFDEPNVLNCYVKKFNPPVMEIELLKNGQKMDNLEMEDMVFSKDWFFYILAHGKFTPTENDTFACRVRHPALKEPKTVVWDELM